MAEKKKNLAETLIEKYIIRLYKKENNIPLDQSVAEEIVELLNIEPEIKRLSRLMKLTGIFFVFFAIIVVLVVVLAVTFL
ncbi:MAG: hypothetical protein ACI4BI_00435 [Anaerotardibacter sp.]